MIKLLVNSKQHINSGEAKLWLHVIGSQYIVAPNYLFEECNFTFLVINFPFDCWDKIQRCDFVDFVVAKLSMKFSPSKKQLVGLTLNFKIKKNNWSLNINP